MYLSINVVLKYSSLLLRKSRYTWSSGGQIIISHLCKVGVSLISPPFAGLLLQYRAESCPVSRVTTNEDNQEWKPKRDQEWRAGRIKKTCFGLSGAMGDHQ